MKFSKRIIDRVVGISLLSILACGEANNNVPRAPRDVENRVKNKIQEELDIQGLGYLALPSPHVDLNNTRYFFWTSNRGAVQSPEKRKEGYMAMQFFIEEAKTGEKWEYTIEINPDRDLSRLTPGFTKNR
ncbi:MAG: hypothetical protein ABH817_00490 [archaeon]